MLALMCIPLTILSDQSRFHSFVSGITANGGGDGPEDIMGGLQAVFSSLSWRSGGSRVSQIFTPLYL